MIMKAPKGKKYIVSNTDGMLEFGTVIDEKGIEYDISQGGSLNLKKVNTGEALLKIIVKEGVESVRCSFVDDQGPEEVEVKYPGDATYICKIGTEYSWSAEVKEGYDCIRQSGKGTVSEESDIIIARGSIKKFRLSVVMDDHIQKLEVTVNGTQETVTDKEFNREVSYGDSVVFLPFMEDGFDIENTPESFYVFDNVSLELKSVKMPDASSIIPVSLKIEGDWNNKAYISGIISTSGLKFFVIYSNGDRKEVTDVSYPNNWGKEVGEQECTFIYTYNGISVMASRKAQVYPKEIVDKYGNVLLIDGLSKLYGIKSLASDRVDVSEVFLGISPEAFRGNCGVRHLTINSIINVIPDGAFEGNTDIRDITFKCRFHFKIGKRAFFGCSNLESLDFLACGDNFKDSTIGDGVTKDVWEGCDKLSMIKITQGNFSKSLVSISFNLEDSGRTDLVAGPVFKYNLDISGDSVRKDGMLIGSRFNWQVFSIRSSDNENKALFYNNIPEVEGDSLNGRIYFYEEGNYLKEYRDAAIINKWSFKETGCYLSNMITGSGNKAEASFEVLGLGSEEFDYSRVKDIGYRFGAFSKLGVLEPPYTEDSASFKVKDVLYPNMSLNGHSCLDYLKPLI